MESKKDIRQRVLIQRNLISKEEWEEKSRKIYERVVTHPFFLNADEIYCYVDCRNEVGTKRIIEYAWQCGKKVAVPKVLGDIMSFYYIENFNELEIGYFNVMEPSTDKPADGEKVLVLMPGAAFDRKKNRIGYGKGFYDKYLQLHQEYHKIALAFELQITEHIPVNEHDIRPDILITEEYIYV